VSKPTTMFVVKGMKGALNASWVMLQSEPKWPFQFFDCLPSTVLPCLDS
jgi:hypothetical protein